MSSPSSPYSLSSPAVAAIAGHRLRRIRPAARHRAQARRVLHPARGLRQADPDVREDRGRQGRLVLAVLRRVGRAGPCREGRARGRPRRPLARTGRGRAREGGPRLQGLEEEALQGHGHGLRRRLRPPRRQPEEDQDVDRPPEAGSRGRHAEPVHVGRCPLEHHGRLRRVAAARARPTSRRRRTCSSCSRTSSSRTRARATR